MAVGLGISEDHLVPYHKAHYNQLRLLHYPSVSAEALEQEKITRIDAHSDYASITLLLQDSVGGLEVEDPQHPGQFRVSAAASILFSRSSACIMIECATR